MAHLDTSNPERLSFPPGACGIEKVSTFPLRHIWANSLDLLVNWITKGKPAPHAPLISMNNDGKSIRRDEHGNALGGVPVPQIQVAIANILTSTERNPEYPRARCDMIGPEFAFDRSKLALLYGNHANYMKKLRRTLDSLIDDGWYLPQYRDDVLETAEKAAERFR